MYTLTKTPNTTQYSLSGKLVLACVYAIASLIIAGTLYTVIHWLMGSYQTFWALYRMPAYHLEYPMLYAMIPCFFFGVIASLFHATFQRVSIWRQLGIFLGIMCLVLVLSSPFGGMLWYYHDMQAGYFPEHWISKMVLDGARQGLLFWWLIVGLSIPFNLLWIGACFWLMKAQFFQKFSS